MMAIIIIIITVMSHSATLHNLVLLRPELNGCSTLGRPLQLLGLPSEPPPPPRPSWSPRSSHTPGAISAAEGAEQQVVAVAR